MDCNMHTFNRNTTNFHSRARTQSNCSAVVKCWLAGGNMWLADVSVQELTWTIAQGEWNHCSEKIANKSLKDWNGSLRWSAREDFFCFWLCLCCWRWRANQRDPKRETKKESMVLKKTWSGINRQSQGAVDTEVSVFTRCVGMSSGWCGQSCGSKQTRWLPNSL